jgi:succinyl-CoA synthetase beta subunit
MVAESILAAYAATGGFRFPVVVRLQGTNCEEGSHLIQTSGFENVLLETDFEAAAQKVVKITGN